MSKSCYRAGIDRQPEANWVDADGKPPQSREPETTKQKSERLKAARLQAELDRNGRVDRATRKAVARRKILGNDKS